MNEVLSSTSAETVLTGIDVSDYRDENGNTFVELLKALKDVPTRIRLGSLEVSLITDEFLAAAKSLKNFAPHFHLSMQSGSDRILGLMRRKYNRTMALHNIELLKEKIEGVMLTTDFIVGFPTETDEDFEETMDFARRANFLDMHVFAYSKRSGTPAAAMAGQIPESVKKERSAALIALGKELTAENLKSFCEKNGRTEVLFETYENGRAFGHTASFVPVSVPSDSALHGELLTVTLTGCESDVCLGRLGEK